MSIKKQNIITVLEYALMLSAVLYSSMWALFTDALSNTFSRIFILILGALIVLNFSNIDRRAIYRAAAIAAFFAVFLFFTRYNFIRTILYLILPFFLCLLYLSTLKEQKEKGRLLLYLSDIIVVFSAVSLVLYILGTHLHFLSPTSQVRVWWAEEERVINTYFHLLYEAQDVNFFGITLMRNCSIFPEAPGFAAYLAVAIGAELFLREKLSYSRLAVLLLSCLTSFSAKAILLAAAALCLKFLFWDKKSTLIYAAKAGLIIAAAALCAVILWDKSKGHSFHIRLDDFNAAFKAFIKNPIFGAGYYNDSAIITHFEYAYRANDGLSMGLAVLLAQGGLWSFGFYILSALKAVLRTEREGRLNMLSFALIFFGMLFITNMPFSMLTIFVISFFAASGREGLFEDMWEGVKKWQNKA